MTLFRRLPALVLAALLTAGPLFAETASFTQTSDAHLKEVEALHEKAENLIEKLEYRKAIELYKNIILLEPDDEAAYSNMGQAYLLLGDHERARTAFYNALHINPDNYASQLGLQKITDPDSLEV